MEARQEAQLEQNFDSFRSDGNAEALGHVFDASGAELLRLALHLAPDAASADDLVQLTFVAAMETADTWDNQRPLMPWLLGILARQAARAQRERSRRPDPERLQTPSAEDPAKTVQQADGLAHIERGVDALPEPYKGVLRAHLLEDRQLIEVARLLSRAPGTVRMQLARGLELLRKKLPASTGSTDAGHAQVGKLNMGLASFAPMQGSSQAALRESVMQLAHQHLAAAKLAVTSGSSVATGSAVSSTALPAASASGSLAVSGSATFAGLFGGIVMQKVIGLGVVLTLLLGAGWYRLNQDHKLPEENSIQELEPSQTAALNSLTKVNEDPLQSKKPSDGRSLAEQPAVANGNSQPVDAGIFIVGELSGFDPNHTTPLRLSVFGRGSGQPPVKVNLYDSGSYEVDVTKLARALSLGSDILLAVNHDAYEVSNHIFSVSQEIVDVLEGNRKELRHDIPLAPATGLAGYVRWPAGIDASEIRLAVLSEDQHGEPTQDMWEYEYDFEPEEDGSYLLRSLEPGPCRIVAWGPGLLVDFERINVAAQQVSTVRDLRLKPGNTAIRGQLKLPPGISAEGCIVEAASMNAIRADWREHGDPNHPETEEHHFGPYQLPVVDWTRDSVQRSQQQAQVDSQGRFSINGLLPGEYQLSLIDAPRSDGMIGLTRMRVEAPASGIHFDPQATAISAQATMDVPLTQGVLFELCDLQGDVHTRAQSQPEEPTQTAFAAWLVGQQYDFTVRVSGDGFLPQSRELPALARGPHTEVLFELIEAPSQLAELLIVPVMESSQLQPPTRLKLDLSLAATDLPKSGTASFDEALKGYLFTKLEPGEYHLSAEPQEEKFGPLYDSWIFCQTAQVQLQAGQRKRTQLQFSSGGRLEVEVRGDWQTEPGSQCILLNSKGLEMPVRYVSRDYTNNRVSVGARMGMTNLHGKAETYPNLPAGRYRIRLEIDGWLPLERSFEIRPGERTQLLLEPLR